MNLYQLDTKQEDAEFLSGKVVSCKVVVSKFGLQHGIQVGDPLVIMLSNGSKYKARVMAVDLMPIGNKAVGELFVKKVETP